MVVVRKRFDLKKIRPAQHGFCLKLVTDPSTNPAQPGLQSWFIQTITSLFSAKIFRICSVAAVVSCSSSLSSRGQSVLL